MKTTKLLTNLLIIGIVSAFTPVLATNDETIESDLMLSVPAYVEITQDNASVTDVQATVVGPTALRTNSNILAKYNIISNGTSKVYVSAQAPTQDGAVNALFGNSTDAMTIVLTKIDGTTSSSAVTNCVGNSANPSLNAGAVAFTFNCNAPTNNALAVVNNNHIEYTVNGGRTILSYLLGTNTVENTFSMKDTSGTYKAVLYVSTIEP